mmetsp:Transcript_2200/g.5868  ORF Transcript_2200/g.5868 Transcript_2200/m.5868 type:complete len:306 (+) Transcript_2200:258-1175(+)
MLMNYHELTMSESRDSPQRKLQFRVICLVIAICFLYTVHISGILLTIEPFETPFPGGNFCFKHFQRDYVASMGVGRRLQSEVLESFPKEEQAEGISVKDRENMIEERIYHVYLDNPEDVGGAHTRWMSGALTNDQEKSSYCDPLFEKNPEIEREKERNNDTPAKEKNGSEAYAEAIYQSIELPEVNSLAIKFPFSNGFSSGLVFSYKIIPEMRALAAEKGEPGNPVVVISQCNVGKAECTHYIPLSKGSVFHAGLSPTEEYQKGIDDTFDFIGMLKGGLRIIVPSLKPYIAVTPDKSAVSENSEL